MNSRTPAWRHHRYRLPLSIVAAATAVATMTATVTAANASPRAAASPAAAASAKPTPLGVTKAPASTPVTSAETDSPLLKSAAADPGVVAVGVGQVPWSGFFSAQLSDSVSAQINYGTGNLLVTVVGFDIADAGPGLSWGNTFNSLNQSGWNATTGADYRVIEATPNAVVVEGPSGTMAVFARDGDGFTPAKGYKQDLTEASDKKSFTLTSRSTGQKTTFTRSGTTGDARVSKVEDKNGNATTIAYAGSFASEITSASGRTLTLSDDGTHITKVTDDTGRSVEYTYTGDLIRTFTDTAGKTTTFDYDSSDRLTKVTTAEGRQTTFTWDSTKAASLTRVVNNTTGAGNTTAFRWLLPPNNSNSEGFVQITDPRGNKTLKTVDGSWRTKETENPLGHTHSTSWGPDNNVATATDAMGVSPADGNVTSYSYDSAFNPTTVTIPTGASATATWVKKGSGYFPETLTSASDEKTTNAYDASGNLLTSQDSTSGGTAATWTYTYNPKSGEMDCGGLPGQRCTATDPRGKKTSYTYNADGDLTKVTPPSPLEPVTYTYDELGRQKSTTDGRGVTTTYTYDDRDRVRTRSAGSATATFTYDADGNLTTRTTPAGTSTFTYDEQSRERTRALPGTPVTSITYDANGNVATATDAAGTVTYGYDDANQLTSVTEPGGAKTTHTYNNNGQRTKTTFPGGTTQTVTPDDSSRPTKVEVKSGSTTLSSITYDYADGGQDTDKVRKRTADGAAITYTYDTAGRLTKAVETEDGSTTAGWAYCYDKAGNRTGSSTGTSLPADCDDAQHTYDYNDAGQLTAYDGQDGFGYDGAGNETAAASPTGTRSDGTWTPFTQLAAYTQSGTTTDQTYAGVDNTHRLTRGSATFTNAAVGLTGQNVSGTATGFVREPSGTLVAMRSGGSSQYYLTDAQGSVIGLVDASGNRTATYTYSPYGEARTADGPAGQPYRYTGTYLDPSGLYKMGARYYDPALGRFTQPDPSGQETNAYLYAGGDPVNRSDPSGLESWPSWSIGGEVCFYLCLGGGYAQNKDGSEGGGYFRVGLGLPGASTSYQENTGNISSGTDGYFYGSCDFIAGSAEANWGGGMPDFGAGPGISTPGCSGGSHIQF
ncbi:RHS repeat-associated core domain-containing protein [Streptomyces sp. TRM 70351]|uniref:RHS repeat-associated core domain-containing protein n=1 Tax=Streptomyces sp. TRM 70351 TaxID=3116552 RepID=UPI002E7B4FCB|nr:RHS repeat-associated core domain-containing protein [Streptomyces sp. TRM 70351]MEE1928730.1 RHS repeat-associated core domain-containing protein [Streptomyces sp. TRM 70351]